MKRCSRCGLVQRLVQFTKNVRTQDGFCYWCRDCRRADRVTRREQTARYDREHRLANWEECRRREDRYAAAHKGERAERLRVWAHAHQPLVNERARVWAHSHPESVRATSAKRNAAKVAQQVAYTKVWRAAHPAQFAEQIRRRAALKRSQSQDSDVTLEGWASIVELWEGRCAYCGRKPSKITQDHVRPLSRGGTHTLSNLLPACGSCNSAKNRRLMSEWSRFSRILIA